MDVNLNKRYATGQSLLKTFNKNENMESSK
jgi:hypothetical protein